METFEELVERYYLNKQQENELHKRNTEDNTTIKTHMHLSSLTKTDADKYTVSITEVKSEKFNDDKLVQKLREIWSKDHGSMTCPWLKMVYVPDMEAIENAIYENELDPKMLAECKDVSVRENLYVKLKKEAKNDN